MAASNAGFTVSTEHGGIALRLRCSGLVFDLVADPDSRTVAFTPAKSGATAHYRLDANRGGEWVSVTDGHLLLEALARELCYPGHHLRGFPSF